MMITLILNGLILSFLTTCHSKEDFKDWSHSVEAKGCLDQQYPVHVITKFKETVMQNVCCRPSVTASTPPTGLKGKCCATAGSPCNHASSAGRFNFGDPYAVGCCRSFMRSGKESKDNCMRYPMEYHPLYKDVMTPDIFVKVRGSGRTAFENYTYICANPDAGKWDETKHLKPRDDFIRLGILQADACCEDPGKPFMYRFFKDLVLDHGYKSGPMSSTYCCSKPDLGAKDMEDVVANCCILGGSPFCEPKKWFKKGYHPKQIPCCLQGYSCLDARESLRSERTYDSITQTQDGRDLGAKSVISLLARQRPDEKYCRSTDSKNFDHPFPNVNSNPMDANLNYIGNFVGPLTVYPGWQDYSKCPGQWKEGIRRQLPDKTMERHLYTDFKRGQGLGVPSPCGTLELGDQCYSNNKLRI